jgi:ubiquinone/menaquinone biosynthesis C-methylase UbiE
MVSARSVLPEIPVGLMPHFSVANVRNLPYPEGVFGTVLCMDLLHWATSALEFESWWKEIWRTLKPGGVLCARFRIRGESDSSSPERSGQHWFLANPASVAGLVEKWGGEWVEPWLESPIKGGGRQGNALVRRMR